MSSLAAVAWPAMIRGSSKGWIRTAPVSSMTSAVVVSRASRLGSQRMTSAPLAADRRQLGPPARCVASRRGRGQPTSLAARLRAWAWLPEEWAGHAARQLVRVELEDGVGGAAKLEGTDFLEVLTLEE